MPDPIPFEELLERWLDHALDPAGIAALARMLDDPQMLLTARAQWELHITASEALRCDRDVAQAWDVCAAVLSSSRKLRIGQQVRRRIQPKVRVRARWHLPMLWSALAACLILGFGWWWLETQWEQPVPERMATLESLTPGVQVVRAGAAIRATSGMTLLAEDRLSVDAGPSETAQIRYPDQSTVMVQAATRLSLWEEDGAKRIRLVVGEVRCDAAHQPSGKPMRIVTDQAVAEVVGTRFSLRTGDGQTRLDVKEGCVELKQGSDRRELVHAGEWAMARDGDALAVHALATAKSLWSEGFEDLSAWGPEPYAEWPRLDPAAEAVIVHGGARALRLRYLFPDAAKGGSSGERFGANYRSLARAVRLPAEARFLRLWVRRISAAPQAWLMVRLRNSDQIWAGGIIDLATIPDGWQPIDFDLANPVSYWERRTDTTRDQDCPSVDPASVSHLVLVAGGGDFDIAVDDIEFSSAMTEPQHH